MQPDSGKETCPDQENLRFDIVGFDQSLKLQELNDHIGFVKQLVASKTPDDLRKRLLNIFNQFGLTDFTFTGYCNHKPHCHLTSLPEELLDCYQSQKLDKYDMALDYLRTDNPGHFYLSDIQQIIEDGRFLTHTFEKNLEIIALFNRFEFNNAYLMPYKVDKETGNKETVLFFLMAKGVTAKKFITLTKSHSAALHLLGDTAIRVYQNKFTSHNPTPRINPKPLRLLTIMAKSDLSLGQAADKLCISTDTANKHMAMAKEMFGSRSQANAVYRAIQEGWIDFD